MLGAKHFKRKIAKKERKAQAKQSAHQTGGAAAAGARSSQGLERAASASHPPLPSGSTSGAAKPASGKKTKSTLKGPVVSYHNSGGTKSGSSRDGRGVRDSGNDAKQVKFPNKSLERQYRWNSGASASVQPETHSKGAAHSQLNQADSKAQRRKLRNKQGDDVLDQFRSKLVSSTFRLLNEQIYSSPNAYASQLLRDPVTFQEYHQGYRAQLALWPLNPNRLIIDSLLGDRKGRFLANRAKSAPGAVPTSYCICDLGCGDAQIAQALCPHGYANLHSYDFCAANEFVTVGDSSHVPLQTASVDIVIFSLSLMATDYFANLVEAHRLLKQGRLLKIVEVRSRIPNPNAFAELVEGIGFVCDWFDVAGDYFIAFDFIRGDGPAHPESHPPQPIHAPADVLLCSAYKKR